MGPYDVNEPITRFILDSNSERLTTLGDAIAKVFGERSTEPRPESALDEHWGSR